MTFHSKASLRARHPIHDFLFANSTAREAGTGYAIVVDDVDKIALQEDDNSYWVLTSVGPLTWDVMGPALVTVSERGLMSPADKSKLDAVAGGNVTTPVRNETGSLIPKGKLVYPAGWSVAHSRPLIGKGDKDDPAKRPIIAITLEDVANNTNSDVLMVGTLSGIDTSMYSLTDQLVLGVDGDYQRPPPDIDPFTGEIQNIGSVSRIDASDGEIIIAIDGMNPVTAAQIFALAGTSGTPSKANRYVTESDPGIGPAFLDSVFRILNLGDPTKKISLDASGITTGNTRQVTVPDYNFDLEKPVVDRVQFDVAHTPASFPAGQVSWNAVDYTMNISSGLGPVLQVGQEMYVIVYNNTGSQIDNGKAVYPVGGFAGRPSVALANAATHVKILGDVVITTMDIPDSQFGIAAYFGKVRDIDTDSWNLGDTLWVSATTDGELTNIKPEFPNYSIQVGGVTVKDASNGEIIIGIKGIPEDTIVNFWNGILRESFDFTVQSNGSTVTGYLAPSNSHPDMTMMFSDGFSILNTDPPASVVLTSGTDVNPQSNYVYVLETTKVLTVSTSDWPVVEHIKIATIVLKSAATTQIEGALRNQNWNDHVESTLTYQGHLSHICEKLRQFEAQWHSGTEGSVVIDAIPAPDTVYVKTTAGVVYQMHKQNFPLFDMTQYSIDAVSIGAKQFTISDDGDLSAVFPDGRVISVQDSTGNDGVYTVASTNFSSPDFIITVVEVIPDATVDGTIGDDIHVVNDFTTPYKTTTDLSSETVDAEGNSLANSSFSFVVWGVQNKTSQVQHLMMNLPVGSYPKNSPELAVSDALNTSVYSIPKSFQGVGFLIARFTFILEVDGVTWSLYDTEDLRGKIPNTTAGGGGGGAGVTSFLGLTDTPNAYTSQALKIAQVNSGETALEFVDQQHANLTDVSTDQHHNEDHASRHTDGEDDIQDATGSQKGLATAAQISKLDDIETDAEVNNISDVDATDLTDAGESTLHYHDSDRARANHTGTQVAATISDFDTEVSNNTDVAANTTHRSSDGSDHSYIDQDVTNGAAPVLSGANFTNITDEDAIHNDVAGEINAVTSKATPVAADVLLIEDSAASWAKKKIALTDLLGGGGTVIGFEAYRTATQSLTTSVETVIQFNNVVNNDGSDFSTSTYKFTAAVNEWYILAASIDVTLAAAGACVMRLYKNSTLIALSGNYSPSSGTIAMSLATAVKPAVNDTFEIRIFQTSGFTATIQPTGSDFSGSNCK